MNLKAPTATAPVDIKPTATPTMFSNIPTAYNNDLAFAIISVSPSLSQIRTRSS